MISHKNFKNTAADNGYFKYKDIVIKRINSITLHRFRSLNDRTLPLGENITLISGKNGTIKTTILGLIAHPFSSSTDAKDIFNAKLKTTISEVFRLSLEKDDNYWYSLSITSADNKNFEEPVRVYVQPEKEGSPTRHRVVVGRTNIAGKGNFLLNTSYTNFKRLYPITETIAQELHIDYEAYPGLLSFVSGAYAEIFGTEAFSQPVTISEPTGHLKHTFGPSKSHYDFNSISSGEDNLGYLLAKLYSFKMHIEGAPNSKLQGIFCIDEIEAGLHPVAQVKFFNFLFNWSKKNNVQIVATTHSLFLIQHAIEFRNMDIHKQRRVQINMLSTANAKNQNYNIIENPSYSQAYKELTYKDINQLEDSYKVTVLCEDDVAKLFLKRLIKKNEILKRLDIIFGITVQENNPGTGYKSLVTLVKNGEKLFYDTLILFDPEVSESNLISKKVQMKILPSLNKLPIEKEIILFVYNHPNESELFETLKRERTDLISEFACCGIPPSCLSSIELLKSADISPFKLWAKNNDKTFKKLIGIYVNKNRQILDSGTKEIINSINIILESKSLPTFEV